MGKFIYTEISNIHSVHTSKKNALAWGVEKLAEGYSLVSPVPQKTVSGGWRLAAFAEFTIEREIKS